jgi:hypothetical protein
MTDNSIHLRKKGEIKPLVVFEKGSARVLYYCTCGGEVYMEKYESQSGLYFTLTCRKCGARKTVAWTAIPGSEIFP